MRLPLRNSESKGLEINEKIFCRIFYYRFGKNLARREVGDAGILFLRGPSNFLARLKWARLALFQYYIQLTGHYGGGSVARVVVSRTILALAAHYIAENTQ